MTDLLYHVGKNIKLYRKAKGITVAELAAKINKSKATVSKYETGGISIDVATLFDIAGALEVEPIRLIDYQPVEAKPSRPVKNPLGETNLLYMYHYHNNIISQSVIKLQDNPNTGKTDATLFYMVEDLQNHEKCDCLYHGEVRSHEAIFCFTFQNYYNSAENILINFLVPMKKISYLVGMMSGLHHATYLPMGCKTILSGTPMRKDSALTELLAISKETFKEMRSRNMLLVF